MIEDYTRTCTGCGKTWPLTCFYRKRRGHEARRSRCKWCTALARDRTYLNPERYAHKLARDDRYYRTVRKARTRQDGRNRREDARAMVDRLKRRGLSYAAIERGSGVAANTLRSWRQGRSRDVHRDSYERLSRFFRRTA